jgi:hypothetical protein
MTTGTQYDGVVAPLADFYVTSPMNIGIPNLCYGTAVFLSFHVATKKAALASDKNCQGMFAVVLRDMRGWQQMGSWLCIAGPLPILSQASAGSAIRSLLESYLLERWEWMDRYSVDRVLNYPRSHTHEGPEIHDRGIHDALHRELLNAM